MTTIHWLGAGLSSVPGIRRLAAGAHPFVIWNRTLEKAQSALDGWGGEARALDWGELEKAVQPGDVVVSMLPADQHVRIAGSCLDRGCHFVSSSYVSPEMAALDSRAKERGLCLVNEVGLDPGIDHLMAHALMDDYRNSELFDPGNAHAFDSFCGGFPAEPNGFRYKFSWSPLGVLRALKTPARWIEHGREVTTDEPWKALSRYTVALPVGDETFQAYPNRDSVPFASEYGFGPEFDLQRFVRGTLRLDGWAEAWGEIFAAVEDGEGLQSLSERLWEQYAYAAGELDRVVLHVALEARSDDGSVWKGEYALDERGSSAGSAMARLVSKTVAIAVEAVLAGELEPGVSAAPSDPWVARAWLEQLAESGEGIVRS